MVSMRKTTTWTTAAIGILTAVALAGCAHAPVTPKPTDSLKDEAARVASCVQARTDAGGLAIQTKQQMEYDCAIYDVHHGHRNTGDQWLLAHPDAIDLDSKWQD